MLLIAVFWGALGLILGSFTNVLILRHGVETLGGRSHCPQCNRTLAWFELFPVFSWVALRGRCRTCKAPISAQYPLVELLMACGLVLLGLSDAPLVVKILGVGMLLLNIAIGAYDIRHMLMPDRWVYAFVALAASIGFLSLENHESAALAYFALSGPAVAFPLFALWFVSRGAWMGFGDVKYAFGMGWLLGFVSGYLALGLAFCAGAFVGVALILSDRARMKKKTFTPMSSSQKPGEGFTMKSEVPFGPFLIVGVCVVWFSALYHIPLLTLVADFLSLS